MKYCTKCGRQMSDDMVFCPKCGTKFSEDIVESKDSITENKEQIVLKKTKSKFILVPIVLIVITLIVFLALIGFKNSNVNPNKNIQETQQSTIKTGKEYENIVWQAFWDYACDFFGAEYSDFKITQTSYSWISDFKTTDGYTSHYYLVKTVYEYENIYGQKEQYPITARCYYVPDYSAKIYIAYMTVNGETSLFDEEKEDWLMGLSSDKEPSSTQTEKTTETSQNYTSNNETSKGKYYNGEYYNQEEIDDVDLAIAEDEWEEDFVDEEIIVEMETEEIDMDGVISHLSPDEYEEQRKYAMGEE